VQQSIQQTHCGQINSAKVSPKKKEQFQKLKQEEIYLRCSDNLGVTVFHPQHQQAYLKHIQFFAFPE
jgi:hypothetical protein